ncbi:MAG: thiamine pyrophosphate-dependent dehydrogenase E1 component subunit alpha [Candidatus Omnitrophica bacterium]|nr:thiamine pyrophosphate-dependent dehydrogenase E1 component subunit alpha [Candidatus Omnitrophota bacterium]
MLLIRLVEEKIALLYPEQEIRCPTHLSIGQEAAASGVCAALKKADYVFSTHRCHSHYLAKGGDVKQMFAELYGKATGCAKGKGGSMHLVDPDQGMMGASAIVGGTIPIAVGAALAAQFQKNGRVSVAFFGDAATEQGVFSESLNFAALKKLPVLFVCENNFFATNTPLSDRQVLQNISERGNAYGVPGVCLEGDDVVPIYQTAVTMVERARRGEGPSILECRSYRWKEHVGPNEDFNLGYRTQQELESWKLRCPILQIEKKLGDINQMRSEISAEIDEAVRFAKESPAPNAQELLTEIN